MLLTPLSDLDDGVILEVPARRAGAVDYPYDVDHYLLSLNAGDAVTVHVDSTQIDPAIRIDYLDSPDIDEDDDSGGGLFGLNAELLFQAEVQRTYRIVIDDPSGESGGYTQYCCIKEKTGVYCGRSLVVEDMPWLAPKPFSRAVRGSRTI